MTVFPRRHRLALSLAIGGSVLALMTHVAAQADDDLKDKKKKVDQQLSQAHDDFDESSAELKASQKLLTQTQAKLVETQKGLEQAHKDLTDAQTALANTQAERAAAEAIDHQMQTELDEAEGRLVAAQHELDTSSQGVQDQNLELRRLVVAYYQQGDPSLMGISTVLTEQSPDKLTGQLQGVNTVMSKEAGLLDRMRATNVLLTVKQRNVRDAKDEVAVKRQAAADNLLMTQALELQASEDEKRVQSLVDLNQKAVDTAEQARQAAEQAKLAAARAKANELKRIQKLEEEREQIKQLIAAAASRTDGNYNGPANGNHWMMWPVNARISSPFGYRMHPILHRVALHDGLDLAAACHTPIKSAQAGKVIGIVKNNGTSGYGNRVIMDNGVAYGVGVSTTYNHLSAFGLIGADKHQIRVGDQIAQGQVIGYVGTTGQSTGCHLHFMVLENGTPVNPIRWL